jgi:hypothetical protein
MVVKLKYCTSVGLIGNVLLVLIVLIHQQKHSFRTRILKK